jgi:hypothetical protein
MQSSVLSGGRLFWSLALWLACCGAMPTTAEAGLVLAREGRPRVAVVAAPDADAVVAQAATDLADLLGRIIGQPVPLNPAQPGTTIALRVEPALMAAQVGGRFAADRYRFVTEPDTLRLEGATPSAVRHAVWDLLHRLGYRYYFPCDAWEVIPRRTDLEIDLNETVEPAYVSRTIFYGWGLWGYNNKPFARWMERNRMAGEFRVSRAHAYQAIVARHQADFDADPAMLALVNGRRTGDKLCIANPKLRQLVARDALDQASKGDKAISMEPSDGGGWCQCDSCAAMGSISDRAVLLANTVADALRDGGYDVMLGMNAYNMHSAPPTRVKPDPSLIATVTTRFLNAGLSFDQVVSGWRDAGLRHWGVRDYPSIFTSDLGLPGQGQAANPRLFAQRLARWHEMGARFYNGESSENWAAQGMGYYVLSRVLWDVREAQRVDAILDEFVTLCYPDAVEPMRRYYQLVNSADPAPLSEDLVGRLYRALQQALEQAREPDTRRRLVLLAAYTHYVELILAGRMSDASQRQDVALDTLKLSYRIKDAMLLHTKGLHRKATTVWPGIELPADGRWRVPEGKNPLKVTEPVRESEALEWVARGVEQHPLFDGPMRAYSDDLVPAPRLAGDPAPAEPAFKGRGTRVYWTWLDQPGQAVQLTVTGGLIGRNQGPVRLSLYAAALDEPVASAEVPNDKQPHAVQLASTVSGLHRLELADRGGMTLVQWQQPRHASFSLGFDTFTTHGGGRYDGVFYVPRGTRVLSLFVATGSDGGHLIAPGGRAALVITDGPRFLTVDVLPGEDGGVWRLKGMLGASVRLLNVPIQIAPAAQALLLPREVVDADRLGPTAAETRP